VKPTCHQPQHITPHVWPKPAQSSQLLSVEQP